ncbi:MAG: DUF1566 domain-containing protein [Candidatus Binatia bacterium]
MRVAAVALGLIAAAVPCTASQPALAQCVGDCDGNGVVSVDEILIGVEIVLGEADLSRCPSFGINGDMRVTVDEILAAVNNALTGCPTPTNTPTAAPTSTPTPTPTPHLVDNGEGAITDTQTGLMWEKKDQAGGLHDVNTRYAWAGYCSDESGLCQPDAASASTCSAATGGAVGCAQCGGTATCNTSFTTTIWTIWQWLNQLNASNFAGYSDWRLPTSAGEAPFQTGQAAELESIVDTGVACCGQGSPCVGTPFNNNCTSGCSVTGCSCTEAEIYWSASTLSDYPDDVWFVNFGGEGGGIGKDGGGYVRAVRNTLTPLPTNAPNPTTTPTFTPGLRFLDNGDGTITNTQTGLMWEKKDEAGGLHDVNAVYAWAGQCSGEPFTFCQPDAASVSACNTATGGAAGCAQCGGTVTCNTSGYTTIWQWLNQLNVSNFAGHSDWRLPTSAGGRGYPTGQAAELESIVDTSVAGCPGLCVDRAFNDHDCTDGCTVTECSCTAASDYWSASTVSDIPDDAWLVNFYNGGVGYAAKDYGLDVRAVR